ncbi:MAG: DnaJ domain-containing protein [Planctomycetales bacterium]|nr:DnaJ domain-containing protein [Planctomycetales bacterium]
MLRTFTLLFGSQQFDAFGIAYIVLLGVAVVVLPVIGYWLTIIDIRAYMRALKGMLVKVTNRFYDESGKEILPDWVLRHTPPCITALGLSWPCTEQEIKDAYRKLAEKNHPDLGGDRQRFLALQTHFEQAIQLVQQAEQQN